MDLLAKLNMPRCRFCARTIWWWQLASHRKAVTPMHFDCFLIWEATTPANEMRAFVEQWRAKEAPR